MNNAFGSTAPDFAAMTKSAGAHVEEDEGFPPAPAAEPAAPEPTPAEASESIDPEVVAPVKAAPQASRALGDSSLNPNLANKIILTLDVLRSLDPREREVAQQIIKSGKEQPENESEAVVQALQAPSLLREVIKALLESKDIEPVDRAFYILRLDQPVTKNLNGLVASLHNTENAKSVQNDRLELARHLVGTIEDLSEEHMGYVRAASAVLNAQNEEML